MFCCRLHVLIVRRVSKQHLTVGCQHSGTPFALISLLHSGNVLVEAFAMFIANVTKIFGKKSSDENAKSEFSVTYYTSCSEMPVTYS